MERQTILDTIWGALETPELTNAVIDYGKDKHGTEYLIVDAWTTLSAINDLINTTLVPDRWKQARPVYLAASDREHAKDVERWPDSHPLNHGPTGGPFASLRTHKGTLDVDSAHANTAPYLMPDGVLSIGEVNGLEVVFSDTHTLCGDCQTVIETEPTNYGWKPDFRIQSGEFLCLACADDDDDETDEEDDDDENMDFEEDDDG